MNHIFLSGASIGFKLSVIYSLIRYELAKSEVIDDDKYHKLEVRSRLIYDLIDDLISNGISGAILGGFGLQFILTFLVMFHKK